MTTIQMEKQKLVLKNRKNGNPKVYQVNNGKGKEINLRNEINSRDSGRRFENLTSYKPSRIKKHEEQYLIEVPPKQECKII